MIKRNYKTIVGMAGGQGLDEKYDELMIRGVSKDTRTIEPGNLYVPLIGEQYDGHEFVMEALAKGAAAVLWQRDHANPPDNQPLIMVDHMLTALQQLARSYRDQLSVRIVGVTGSNGKTTTKDMIASILSTTYRVHKTKGNLNGDIGLPLTLLEMREDTQMAVLEMGMRGRGEIELLTNIAKPEVAVITNVGESHLERLGSKQEIARAKMEIVDGLQSGGLFVYNGDDLLLTELLTESEFPESMLRFCFGSSEDNDYYPAVMMFDNESKGTYFTLNTENSPSFYIPLLGRHNVVNALAAIAVSKYMGVAERNIAHGLQKVQISDKRFEWVKGNTGLTIINDAYNASPTAMVASIQLLVELKGYVRKIAVLGDMLELGEMEQEYHREIGRQLDPQQIDYVITYGTLGRYIAEEAEKRFPAGQVKAYQDKGQIIREIASFVNPQDVVLVKGSRGMQLEEVVEGLRVMM